MLNTQKTGKPVETVDSGGETPLEKLQNLIIPQPSISLKSGEVCFYEGPAQSYHSKNVVTGYKGGNAGVSVRIAKGVSVHTGGSERKAVRQKVAEKYNGSFYITNKRLILIADKYGFVVSIPTILQMQFRKDGMVVHTSSKQHSFLSSDITRIKEIIDLMNASYSDQEGIPYTPVATQGGTPNNTPEKVHSKKTYRICGKIMYALAIISLLIGIPTFAVGGVIFIIMAAIFAWIGKKYSDKGR